MSDALNVVLGMGLLNQKSRAESAENKNKQLTEQSSDQIGSLQRRVAELEAEVRKYKSQAVPEYIKAEGDKLKSSVQELHAELAHYQSLLSLPLRELVKTGYSDYKVAYAEQKQILSKFMIDNKAIKELCSEYGVELKKTNQEISEDLLDAQDRVLNQESLYGNNVTQEELQDLELLDNLKIEQKNNEKNIEIALAEIDETLNKIFNPNKVVDPKVIKPNI